MPNNPELRIEKIGGDDAFSMSKTLAMIVDRQTRGARNVYIFSAMKDSMHPDRSQRWNSTTIIIAIADHIAHGRLQEAKTEWNHLHERYQDVICREFHDQPRSKILADACRELFAYYGQWEIDTTDLPTPANDYYVAIEASIVSPAGGEKGYFGVGVGEIITSRLFAIALGCEAAWIPPLVSSELAGTNFFQRLGQRVVEALTTYSLALVSGYPGSISGGILTIVGRGYSDWTAAQLTVVLRQTSSFECILAIRKLFPLSSADPRIVNRPHKLTHISYRLLLEMIDARGAGAPFVNAEAAMPELFRDGGTLLLYTEQDTSGTRIDLAGPPPSTPQIQYVQSRIVTTFQIQSYYLNTNGYLAHVSDFFSRRNIAILTNSSSATIIDITLDHLGNPEDLLASLRLDIADFEASGSFDTQVSYRSHAMIFLGGEHIDIPGILTTITRTLAEAQININTIIQTLSPLSIALSVPIEYEHEAVRLLHEHVVKCVNE